MKERAKITSASVRWDSESDPDNPGWVMDILHLDGRKDTFCAAPAVYHEPEDGDQEWVLEATLAWEGLVVDEEER